MSAPQFPRRVSVTEVIENARCELYDAVQENIGRYPWIERWAAGFDFAFVVDRDVNANADTSYLVPIQLGTFTIGLKSNLKQKAKGSYTFKYKILKGLGKFALTDCSSARSSTVTGQRLLNGEIGLRRWLNEAIPQIESARISNSIAGEPAQRVAIRKYTGEISELGYTIEFVVTVDGSLLPSWALTYPDKSVFKPGFTFQLSEAVTHKLIVALTPIAIERDEPADKTAILGTVDNKPAIIARRVCVMNAGEHSAQCATAPTAATIAAAREARFAAVKENEAAQRAEKQLNEEVATIKNTLPPSVRNLTNSQIRTTNFEGLSGEHGERLISLRNKLQELETAEARRNEAAKQLQERQTALKNLEMLRAAEAEHSRAVRERAVSESEAETSRRLDMIIQQQVIRDAFRQ